MEEYINNRMGLTLKNLWDLRMSDKVYAGRTRQENDDIKKMAGNGNHRAKNQARPQAMKWQKKSLQAEEKKIEQKIEKKVEQKVKQDLEHKYSRALVPYRGGQRRVRSARNNGLVQVMRPLLDKGMIQQKRRAGEVVTALDEMLIAKNFPGQYNV